MPKKRINNNTISGDKNKSVEKKVEQSQLNNSVQKNKQRLSINSQNFVMFKVGDFDQHYVIDGKLGQGCFGTVYKVKHKRLKIERALKIIKKRLNGPFSSFEEIAVLKKLDHSNILKIYQFYESTQDYYIVTEIFDGEQLFNVISQQDKLTEKDAANIMKQILRAVNYSHSLKISHRDIKPENILVKKTKDKFRIKIIDWGLGSLMGDKTSSRICGTPQYCAPEVLKGSHNLSCDLWSIGAIAYVMLTGQMPFSGDNTQQTINKVKKGIFNVNSSSFKVLSLEAKSFIISLMNKNPQKRLTASQALQHSWIQKYANKQTEPIFLKQTLLRLRQFNHSSRFGIAVVSFINNHLSQQKEKEHLQQIFKHLDTDNNGVLSFEQLVEGYTNIYGKELGKQIALETFSKLDINNNQSLEFSQFVTFGLKLHKEQQELKLREAFDMFDRDKNGKISLEEISQVLKGKVDAQLEQQIREIIHEIDQNGDEEIDINEFINCIQKMGQNKAQINPNKPLFSIKQAEKAQKTKVKAVKPKIKPFQTKQGVTRLLRSNSKNLS